jgi:hypothetical protein
METRQNMERAGHLKSLAIGRPVEMGEVLNPRTRRSRASVTKDRTNAARLHRRVRGWGCWTRTLSAMKTWTMSFADDADDHAPG